ncbi:MAG: hypothetical protein RJA57_1222 [Bacteroidota bacterium]|jgi:UDP-N-acetylglucosamine diphosphorylase/glucosamine-1-phosphate N-acetyltransferase
MDKILFTEEFCQPENLHPFTLTRQIQDIRIGILTIREKWERWLGLPSYDKKEEDYKDLSRSVLVHEVIGTDSCFMVHGNVLPSRKLVKQVRKLQDGQFLATEAGAPLVYRFSKKQLKGRHKIRVGQAVPFAHQVHTILFPWDIVRLNDTAIRADFDLLTRGRKSVKPDRSVHCIEPSGIFIEKGARLFSCTLNATEGPIYIGRNAVVLEGCTVRGPFALGEGACLKMGARVYGATTIGPGCTVGGEVKNSVLFGYSNKAHEGYLGDSVIGEWCNLGAGTSNSNLKNNAGAVRVWTPSGEQDAGQKCGFFMGDHTRTAIQTAINTGTVIGVCCHVFGPGLTPKYIPSFSWGSDGLTRYEWGKVLNDVAAWKRMKGLELNEEERSILSHIFERG